MPNFKKKFYTTENRDERILFTNCSDTPVMSNFLGGNILLWKDTNTNQIKLGRSMDGEIFTEKEELKIDGSAYGPKVLFNVLDWIWITFTDENTKRVKLIKIRGALQETEDIFYVEPDIIETEYIADSEVAIEHFKNQIYMAFKGKDNKIFVVRSQNGEIWTDAWSGEATKAGPALKRYKDKLILGWSGMDSRLNLRDSYDGLKFENKKILERKSNATPWLETQDDKLYYAFKDAMDNRPAVLISNDGEKFNGQITFNGETCGSGGTSMEITNGKINMLWTTESKEIKLMKFNIKQIVPTDIIEEA